MKNNKAHLKTFSERQKADYIHSTYFNEGSKHKIGLDLFNNLNFYGLISQKEFVELTEKFDKIGNKLWKEMNKFDKKKLK